MKKLILGLAATAALLTGCAQAGTGDYTGDAQFVVKYVEGTRCIIWVTGSGNVGAMQCDFGGAR